VRTHELHLHTSLLLSLTPNNPESPPLLCRARRQHQERIHPLQQAIACVVEHGNQRLRQRRHTSVLRPHLYLCQITCTPLSRVQIVRSISSRWRFKGPRVATAPDRPIRHGTLKMLSLSAIYYYNIMRVGVYLWVWAPISRGVLGVMSHASKLFWCTNGTSLSGGQGGGGASAGYIVHTPNTSSRSNQKFSRENSNLDKIFDSYHSKKQKQQLSGSQSSSQTCTADPTHIDFQCVTININGFTEQKWEYILSLPIIKNGSVIILTEHHLSGTFCPKEVIDSEWNIREVAGVPKRRGKQHQHRSGVAIPYREASKLKVEQHRIADGTNGSSHQAMSWTIRSPLIAASPQYRRVYESK